MQSSELTGYKTPTMHSSKLSTIWLLAVGARAIPQANPELAPVPSVCNPLMPLEVYEQWSKLKDVCKCLADKSYSACTSSTENPDNVIECGVRWCQQYNYCEVANPCAETDPPGISILNCSTTVSKEPPFPFNNKVTAASELLGDVDLGQCLADQQLPGALKAWLKVTASVLQGAVGQSP